MNSPIGSEARPSPAIQVEDVTVVYHIPKEPVVYFKE